MKTQPRKLTCYIKKTQQRPETWEGFCVDVDVPAIGDSYEAVLSMIYDALSNYLDYIYQHEPDDEQLLIYRPMPGGDAFKLMVQERVLQHLPFSKLQIRKVHINAERGVPPNWIPATPNCVSPVASIATWDCSTSTSRRTPPTPGTTPRVTFANRRARCNNSGVWG